MAVVVVEAVVVVVAIVVEVVVAVVVVTRLQYSNIIVPGTVVK